MVARVTAVSGASGQPAPSCGRHHDRVTLGLLGALVAALAYGAGTVLQALGVRRMAAMPQGTDLGVRARVGWAYAVGLGFDAVGFVASVAALRTLPLFLVESA